MNDFDETLPNIRGGALHVSTEDIENLVSELLEILSYKKIATNSSPSAVDRTYYNNKSFWDDALTETHFQGMKVQLHQFHITEWLPYAPGRYFSSEAKRSRHRAFVSYDSQRKEFDISGKTAMILGGIGSVRLKAHSIDSEYFYFLGATSSGRCHEGIPLAMRETEYRQVIQIIKSHGGCLAHITGTLQILPVSLSLIKYDKQTPKYCLLVDKIEIITHSSSDNLYATIAIAFQLPAVHKYEDDTIFNKGWSFTTFQPGSTSKTLPKAVDWLTDYVHRHTDSQKLLVLSDFDEHYQHFPTEFSLNDLFAQKLDEKKIKNYLRYYNRNEININQMYVGVQVDKPSKVVYTSGGDYAEGNIINEYQRKKGPPSSPWITGSFYLVVFLVVIVVFSVVGRLLPFYILPVVIAGGLLALTIIGAFQLRQDDRINEDNFLKLMALSLKYLPGLRKNNTKME